MLIGLLDVSPSTDVWHDTVFQLIVIAIVTLIAAIIGSLVSFGFSRKQHNRKEITYQVISDAPIVSINKALEDRVEIRLDSSPIKDARLLVLKVRNSGNVAV